MVDGPWSMVNGPWSTPPSLSTVHRLRVGWVAGLASFYPACRECAHRADVRLLPPPIARGWNEVLKRSAEPAGFTAEGYEASSANALSIDDVRVIALALGNVSWRSQTVAAHVPQVLLGTDGHWSTADLVHAAGEALVWAGCQAVDVGAVTTAALAFGAQARGADAALWIGNATGSPHAISLRCFGPDRPWSSPGGLDAVRDLFAARPQRPKRGGGGQLRADVTEAYLAPLQTWFHALRPLRFVVDTSCEPWLASMNSLASGAACEVVPDLGSDAAETLPPPVAESWLQRRLRSLGRRVVAGGCHFGLWVDGAGESCRLVDERGHSVDGEKLCRLLARRVCQERSGAVVALEPAAHRDTRRALETLGASVVLSGETREATSRAIEESGAAFAAGPSGRFYFAGHSPAPDAMLATSLLLSILSQSDRPLSDVLDEASAVGYKGH